MTNKSAGGKRQMRTNAPKSESQRTAKADGAAQGAARKLAKPASARLVRKRQTSTPERASAKGKSAIAGKRERAGSGRVTPRSTPPKRESD